MCHDRSFVASHSQHPPIISPSAHLPLQSRLRMSPPPLLCLFSTVGEMVWGDHCQPAAQEHAEVTRDSRKAWRYSLDWSSGNLTYHYYCFIVRKNVNGRNFCLCYCPTICSKTTTELKKQNGISDDHNIFKIHNHQYKQVDGSHFTWLTKVN